MELNGINSSTYTAAAYTSSSAQTKSVTDETIKAEDAVVYEKAEPAKKSTYTPGSKKVDQATIDKLKADAEARYAQLADLVEKLMTKQGSTYKYATLSDLMKGVQKGEVTVDPEIVAQAKKDVADDGYWGVEQTASRIVDFAKALSGGDPSKIAEMRKAIDKGFKGATKEWGNDLPDISSKTYSRINELLDEWANE